MRQLTLVTLLMLVCTTPALSYDPVYPDEGAPVGERFIIYYLTSAEIIAEYQDDPPTCENALAEYYDAIAEDYVVVTNAVNEFEEEERAAFMEEFLEPLMHAMDLYWDTAFSPAGESDVVFELLDSIPMLDLMALEPYFPPPPAE